MMGEKGVFTSRALLLKGAIWTAAVDGYKKGGTMRCRRVAVIFVCGVLGWTLTKLKSIKSKMNTNICEK